MLSEAKALRHAVWASRAKIAVFLSFVLICVVIVGSTMHVIEGRVIAGTDEPLNPGFDSIPESMYWAIVTMTNRRLRRHLSRHAARQSPRRVHDDSRLLHDHRPDRNRHG